MQQIGLESRFPVFLSRRDIKENQFKVHTHEATVLVLFDAKESLVRYSNSKTD